MKIKLFSLLLTSVVGLFNFNEAIARKMEGNYKADKFLRGAVFQQKSKLPFPMKTGFTDAYLKATFWKCNYTSADPQHAYWVILPNIIRPTSVKPQQLSKVGLTNIGVYNTIDKTLPYIEVWVAYETVKPNITPSAWLLNKIKITGETILNQSIINYPDGQKNLDVLTSKRISNGETVISRFTGVSHGNNFFVLKASCNERDYVAQSNTIFHIVSHWGLK